MPKRPAAQSIAVENTTTESEIDRRNLRKQVFNDLALQVINNAKVPPAVNLLHLTGQDAITNVEYCTIGSTVDNRFFVLEKLKQGGYGQVYKVREHQTGLLAAMKVERANKDGINIEARIMTKFQTNSHCPRFVSSGFFSRFMFVVMQLLGSNLHQLRRQCCKTIKRFSISTTHKIMLQCMEALKGLHRIGFVHRDVKPENITIGIEQTNIGTIFLIDYGMARYWVDHEGDHKPFRDNKGFRGTVKYASVNAHAGRELSRRDDLWSLLYTYIEMATGSLPWDNSDDINQILQKKTDLSLTKMAEILPSGALQFATIVANLEYVDTPDYAAIVNCLNSILHRYNVSNETLDWLSTPNCEINAHFKKPNVVQRFITLVAQAVGFNR